MALVNFLLFLLGSTGLTILLTKGGILEFFRDWISDSSERLGYLVNCPMCSGFWIGLASGFVTGYSPLLAAGAVSLLSWTASNIVESLYAIGLYFDDKVESGEE
jgi:hypothetical protein